MRKPIYAALLSGALLHTAGCGTLVSGTSEEISISTDPDDASIYLNDRRIGAGDVTVDVSRLMLNGAPTVRVEREGYRTQEFRLQTKFNNVSLLGSELDYRLPHRLAMFEYAPMQYHIQLMKQGAATLDTQQRVAQLVLINADTFRRELAAGEGELMASVSALAADGDGDQRSPGARSSPERTRPAHRGTHRSGIGRDGRRHGDLIRRLLRSAGRASLAGFSSTA